jgi:hypothetical protein
MPFIQHRHRISTRPCNFGVAGSPFQRLGVPRCQDVNALRPSDNQPVDVLVRVRLLSGAQQ